MPLSCQDSQAIAGPPLVLSIFPGIDLLGRAFEETGFCVVRGPDLLWGGDIHTFHPPAGAFGGVIGGPPCQAFSRLRYVNPLCGLKHGNLIPEFERVVAEAQPQWWLMENVPGSPEPAVSGYHIQHLVLNNRWLGERQERKRRFSFGCKWEANLTIEVALFESPEWEPAVLAHGGKRVVPIALQQDGRGGHRQKTRLNSHSYSTVRNLPDACELQGLPRDFLSEAPFTGKGKFEAVGNGVPLPMGRAVAKAVKKAISGG